MAITVLKHQVPWGPFSRAQVRDGLDRGDFDLQCLAHTPGLKEWQPLAGVLEFYDRHADLPPLPSAAPVWPHPLSPPEAAQLPPVPPKDLPPAAPPLPPAPVAARPPALPEQTAPVAKSPLSTAAPTPASSVIELRPAPFFPRFFAFAIDVVVLFLPIIFLFGLGALTVFIRDSIEHADSETRGQEWALLFRNFEDLLFLVATGGAWLYAASLECSRWQATVGKQWFGFKVVDRLGRRLSFFRATGRHAAKYLSALPIFLGFTTAFFSRRGLALHDRIAGTLVVRK